MKVLVLTTTFPRWKDDTTPAFVYELSKRLQKNGLEIIVLAPHCKGARRFEIMNGMKIYRFPYFYPAKYQKLAYGGGILPSLKRSNLAKIQVPLLFLSELFYAMRIIRKEKIDVIHSHWIIPSGLIGVILKSVLRKPIIVTIHGSDAILLNGKVQNIYKFILSSCDICTVVSTAIKNQVLNLGVVWKKTKVIPMGVDDSIFNPNMKYNIKKSYNVEGHYLILFVGRLSEEKGVAYLIEAMPEILKEIPNISLMIIGDGPEKNNLEELVKRLNLAKNIIFRGWIPNKDLNKVYRNADIFVLPSLREGLPVVLLEAMACGTPVVASKVGGIPDIIKNGENGFLIEPKNSKEFADKIIRLLLDEKLKQKFSEEGLKIVQKRFSWNVVVEKFVEIYRDLLKKKTKRYYRIGLECL